ncbi:PREDICTED: small subunit processome component 20 homolog [Priapulus caudatus]|uniref:Small subunit processome component 20 homolog n=1 Tax=Priapulus caudatus TaxID=37621 RepID=A0ABM1EPF0_PRICU|nr:PREDICTED: small subunit processome component 20 homolog [Priapulus caudatus]
MTYKHAYLAPYRENFERLLDDKTFRIEIVHFSVSEDNPAIEEQHRAGVLPILMRILYGKMQIKTGSKSTGAKHANMRKSIVLRFLAACQQVELKTFIDLIFTPFHHFLSDDPFTKVKQLMRDIDYHAVIPLKRQISVLNTLDMIFSRLGARIESYLPEMFQITICLASICVQALEDRTKVAPRYVNVLKNIRGLCLNRILQFFTSFDKYPFTAADLDAVFEVAVWPQLPRIAFESAYNPSVLLKLFQLWSENPRFHALLGKHHADNPGLTPLAYVFQLLSAKNVSAGVLGAVMGIVERLLAEEERSEEEEEEEEGSKLPPLEVNHCLDVNVAAKAAGFDVATLGFGQPARAGDGAHIRHQSSTTFASSVELDSRR